MRIKKRVRPDQLTLFPERTGQLEMGFDVEREQYIRIGTAIIRIVAGSGDNPEFSFYRSSCNEDCLFHVNRSTICRATMYPMRTRNH